MKKGRINLNQAVGGLKRLNQENLNQKKSMKAKACALGRGWIFFFNDKLLVRQQEKRDK